ncbi:uncharacterized protein LOC111872013 isoform X4 [Cryptotermes secundus]|uniref:uncharacterized protein LOC111872013 isoform X4 n=1 Tax=Cryptotermes secundus TaxID=105785 RepID=UPI000CD7C64A|nr:uncharacterized protein LOC111872013 isoform X4 [Cryptotermes secundus]
MEEEKSEIESEVTDGIDGEHDMKQGDIKPELESLTLDKTVECENIIDTTKDRKEEDDSKNMLSAAAVEEAMDEDNSNKDDDKDPAVEACGAAVPVDFELDQKNDEVLSEEKMTVVSIKSRSDIAGVMNGDSSTITSARDITLPTEDISPLSTNLDSQTSQVLTSVTGNRNSSTSTLSSVSSTRSTRSQNPEFLARHRNFLHKLHLTSNNVTDEELLTDDDESITSKATSRSGGSVQTEENSGSMVDNLAVRRKRERSVSNGTLSPRVPSPGFTSMIGGSVSANNSGSSSPTGSQMQPATKKRRSTRTDSTGAQQLSPVAAAVPVAVASADRFCWLCHKDGVVINCETCPRVYHLRCIQLEAAPTEDWVCPECITILHAENTDTRSRAMKLLSLDQLCNLLKYAVSRMKTYSGAEPFWKAVDVTEFPQYREYVAHPMDLSLLERNMKKRMYGSTEAFVADAKWILHNCIIFNTYQSRLTGVARVLVKICKQEMSEIENCPDCYLNAHTRKDSWFIEVCRKPHILVWAKLKGFPFWPAKVMRTNKEGMVDVRFFGAHDRAWVPVRECFLYSKAMPGSTRNKKRNNLDACIQEVEQHTKKLRDKFGAFEHAPFRTLFDPSCQKEQLHMLLPGYDCTGDGEPSPKRSKLPAGGFAVRTYQRSQQSDREAQERNKTQTSEADELKTTVASDRSGYKRNRIEKRKLWDRDIYSDNEKRASRSYKRMGSGSSVCDHNSISSEDSQENDEGTLKVRGSSMGADVIGGKSASLVEWSRFEESAAKLSVGVSDEDKQTVTSEGRKVRDSDDRTDTVLPCSGAKVRDGETGMQSSEVEKDVSHVVKKVLGSPSIAEKLQEKLFGLDKSSEECKDAEDAPPEVVSRSTLEKQEDFLEVENKTEESSRMSKGCETSSTTAKENDGVTNVKLETSCNGTRKPKVGQNKGDSKDGDLCGSERDEHDKERSESPVINKSPLKSEPKHYGKQYSPKVVLYNLVLPPGKILQGKIRCLTRDIPSSKCLMKDVACNKKLPAAEEKHVLSPAEPKQAQEISPGEEHTYKGTSFKDSEGNSHTESLLKNRLEVSDIAKEQSSINPKSRSCLFLPSYNRNVVQTDKLNVVQNDHPTDVNIKAGLSDNSSESGDGDIVMDSSKRTPEHGYSRCSIDDSLLENNAKVLESSNIENTKPTEQAGVVAEKDVEQDDGGCALSAVEPVQGQVSILEPVQEKNSAVEPIQEQDHILEPDRENGSAVGHVQEKNSASGPVQENCGASGPVQEAVRESKAVQSSTEKLETESVMDTKPAGKEVIVSEPPSDVSFAVCVSQNKTVICGSLSSPADTDFDPLEERSEGKSLTEEMNSNKCSEMNGIEQSEDKVSDETSKGPALSDSDRVGSVASSSSSEDNSDVSMKLSACQAAVLKVYPAKTSKALDKKIKDCKTSELAPLQNDETSTAATVVTPSAGKEDFTNRTCVTDGSSILCKKIKEEPLDPDELMQESSSASASTLSNRHNSAKTSPAFKHHSSPGEKTEADGDKFSKGKIIVNKKLNSAMLDDKDRLASNDSPSSVSEKDGIFPSLFLDPSITITVINDKPAESVEVPALSKSKISGSDINVNELRASVNLSKDISLTVVGAGYGGHSSSAKGMSSGAVTSLDMECDHESDHDESHNSSTNATSGQAPLTVQNVITGQNSTGKQKRQRPSGGSDTHQPRSRARKSFPNRPPFTNIKVKSHPELVNGVGSFGSKSSVQRRNSAGTNSNSSDSRRSSYGTSPQEILMSAQQSGDTNAENFGGSDNNNNNPSSAMVVLPPMLGTPSTNHIQALRTVNSNIGSPSHIVNGGADIMTSRMMQVPHSQTHPVGNSARISPVGQGPGASRMPPQLQPRPSGPLLSQHPPSVPSDAGPVSADLNRHAHKLNDFLRTTVEEILRDLSNIGSPEATIKSLQIELEKLQWRHNQEMAEMKHNTDLIVMEMRASMETERQRVVAETIRQCELEKQRAVEETKKKQWCTNCGKEALFYCCWNTSYCDYPCQQRHWPQHMSTCAQNTQQGGDGSVREGDTPRSSPQTSGGSSNHKASPSQQQQQKLQQVVSNGSVSVKPPVGPPPSYSGTVLAQAQRSMGPAVGRVPAQYTGLLPMARPASIQVSGYTSSQPSTTTSDSLTTSATGNFVFLSPLTLAGRNNTGAGVEQDSKTLPRQDVRVPGSILGNDQGNISETLAGLGGAAAVCKQGQMNSSGSSDNCTTLALQGNLFETAAANTVQPVVLKTPDQSCSIDVAGVRKAQLVHMINLNVGNTGVPVFVGTSGSSLLTGNVASGHSLNLIPATLPVEVAYQPMVPNVLYQSQVYSA